MFKISIAILFVLKLLAITANAVFEPTGALLGLFDFAISCSLVGAIGLNILKKPFQGLIDFKNSELYFEELYKVIFYLILIFGISVPFNEAFADRNLKEVQSLLHALFSNIVSILATFSAFSLLKYYYEKSIEQIHRKTKKLNKAIRILLTLLFGIGLLADYNHADATPMYSVILTAIWILAYLNAKQNMWLFSISAKKKWKIIFYSFVGIVLNSIIISFALNLDLALNKSMKILIPGSEALLAGIAVIGSAYFCRLLFANFKALPNSKIVARKSSEAESLAHLNRLVAETIEPEKVIEAASKLALQFNENSPIWVELYKDNKIEIAAFQMINSDVLEDLTSLNLLRSFIKSADETCLVPSINDDMRLNSISYILEKYFKSIIVLPLYSSGARSGSIIITHTEAYGFEKDNMNTLSAFSYNVGTAIENARLLKESIEKEKYKKELIIAKQIQTKLLPQSLPHFNNFILSAYSDTADEVGGDYYDALLLKNNKLALLIGDVSGKGIGAAFYMAKLKGAALSASKSSDNPADLLKKINEALYGAMEKQMYITLSCITIDADGAIEYARAGHTPALFKNKNGLQALKPNGLGIGLANSNLFDKNIETLKLSLSDGEMILLYTDGVNEARNYAGEEFGFERIVDSLTAHSNNNIKNPCESLIADVKAFTKNAPLHDDTTIMTIQYKIN